jgi:hypothetical protein
MARTGKGFLEAAYQVLVEAGQPMHGREIVQECLARGLWETSAFDPVLSGTTTLYSEVQRRPNLRGFTALGRGMFGLREWQGAGLESGSHEPHIGTVPGGPSGPSADGSEPVSSNRRAQDDAGPISPRTETEISRTAFIQQLSVSLGRLLAERGQDGAVKIARDNIVQARFAKFPGCHFEYRLHASSSVEVGLHFESGKAQNYSGMEVFRSHKDALAGVLGEQLRVEKWGDNWARVVYVLPKPTLTAVIAADHAARLHRLIVESLPILAEAYAELPVPGGSPRQSTAAGFHVVIDARVGEVRAFLAGRAQRPSDERLCDWIHLCYEFELYHEGRDLFPLVDPSQVNPWYYERARRLAKVCAIRTAGEA